MPKLEKQTTVIGAKHVDSFRLLKQDTRKLADNAYKDCAFRGCNRAGRVQLFWREKPSQGQQKEYICVRHALDLANDILTEYKFGED